MFRLVRARRKAAPEREHQPERTRATANSESHAPVPSTAAALRCASSLCFPARVDLAVAPKRTIELFPATLLHSRVMLPVAGGLLLIFAMLGLVGYQKTAGARPPHGPRSPRHSPAFRTRGGSGCGDPCCGDRALARLERHRPTRCVDRREPRWGGSVVCSARVVANGGHLGRDRVGHHRASDRAATASDLPRAAVASPLASASSLSASLFGR